jgi:uncharacterized heparinase superfamily protein
MEGATTFRFLNEAHGLTAAGGWNDPQHEKLWLYNLHYFDDLNATGAPSRHAWHQALLLRWIAENHPTAGNGWEPYPTSLRIVNWIKWSLAGNALPDAVLSSLALQARWLSQRLEWHLLGNHLFANAKALLFAGLFLEGEEPTRWRETALAIIFRQLPEQVLPDGGNFERSPMYHAIFLEDLLDMINGAAAFPGSVSPSAVEAWGETARRMLAWMGTMTHPDGEIALFNDAAFGIAPSPVMLAAYAARLGLTATVPDQSLLRLPDSGYIRLQTEKAVALLDVAPVGPDYLPGHAHADTLSFELSVHGWRVVVNGGTSRYGGGNERLAERRTRAHSTLEINGEDSSEVWGGFRVARRARPFALEMDGGLLRVACSHDGYRRLPGRPVHRRDWLMDASGITVTDRIEGRARTAVARFILHPQIQVSVLQTGIWRLVLPDGRSMRARAERGLGHLEEARYAPYFGQVLPAQCLSVVPADGQVVMRLSWD